MQRIFLIFFCLMILPKGISQIEVPEFSHVIVPEQYEFLKGKDKHQLNSLTKFLLNKNGFKAVFEDELTAFNKCDVLWADLLSEEGLIYTKLTLILRNCNDDEVARSEQGKSKQKDYKKAYHESLRNALGGFFASQFQIIPSVKKEITIPPPPKKDIQLEVIPKTTDVLDMDKPMQVPVKQVEVPTPIEHPAPLSKTFRYEMYSIISNAAGGYQIQQNGAAIGKLIPTSTPNLFLVRTSLFYGVAHKISNGFIVEREVEGLNSLLIMKFE